MNFLFQQCCYFNPPDKRIDWNGSVCHTEWFQAGGLHCCAHLHGVDCNRSDLLLSYFNPFDARDMQTPSYSGTHISDGI